MISIQIKLTAPQPLIYTTAEMTKCGNCGKEDHNSRTCKEPKKEMPKKIIRLVRPVVVPVEPVEPVEVPKEEPTFQELAKKHPNPKVLEQFTAYEVTMNTLHSKVEELMECDCGRGCPFSDCDWSKPNDTCARCDKGGWEYNKDKKEWLCYEHRHTYEETKEKIIEKINTVKQQLYYDTIPQCPETERAFHHMMTKLGVSFNSNYYVIWALMKHSYDMSPTNFRVLGGFHTDETGKLYFSVKHTLSPKIVNTIHFYGALRYNTFTAHTMTYKAREHIYTFNYDPPKIKQTGYSILHE